MQYCAQPGCPARVEKGRCPKHAVQMDRARGTAQERGYTYGWAKYSAAFRRAHPICGERASGRYDDRYSRCLQQGLTTPSTCVDHIKPLSQGGSMWDEDNHIALCLACNTWKASTLEREGLIP